MFPVIDLAGTPHERGVAHGRAVTDRVAHNLAVYRARFTHEAQLAPAAVAERAEHWWRLLQADAPRYAAALAGIAEGAGQPLLDVVALNVRYELLYSRFAELAMVDGCSAFAVRTGGPGGTTLMGQNWDWIPEVQGAVMREAFADGTRVLYFTEAGIAGGKIGLNAHGVGLAVNGMTTVGDAWGRAALPFHVRCQNVLRQRTLADAEAAITDGARACAANFVVAQADAADGEGGAHSLEAAPEVVGRVAPTDGVLVHTNHFLDPEGLGVAEPPSPYRPGSIHRLQRLDALLRAHAPVDVDALQTILRDHDGRPNSVCRHVDPSRDAAYETVTSAILDLDRRELWLTDGPPCQAAYQHVALGDD